MPRRRRRQPTLQQSGLLPLLLKTESAIGQIVPVPGTNWNWGTGAAAKEKEAASYDCLVTQYKPSVDQIQARYKQKYKGSSKQYNRESDSESVSSESNSSNEE